MFRFLIIITGIAVSFNSAFAEMKALDDEVLSGVSGQSGLALNLEAKVEIGELAYFDDGKGVALQGVRLSSAADPAQLAKYYLELGILAGGDLSLTFKSENVSRFEIEEIRFVDTPGLTPISTDPSIGGVFIDYDIEGSLLSYNRGNSYIGPNNVLGGLYDLEFTITNGRLGYRTNGNEFLLDGMTLDVSSLGMIFGVTPAGELNLSMPNLLAELSVDALRFSNNPLNHGVSGDIATGDPLPSYGSLWVNLDLNTDLRIKGGGADGLTGMTINSTTIINRMDIAWGDDTDWNTSGYWVGALGISGVVDLQNLTVDVLDDSDAGIDPAKDFGLGLALAFERLEANLHIEDFVLGVTKKKIDTYDPIGNGPIQSIGSVDINLLFADGIYNSDSLENRVLLQAGGNLDAGYQGLRLDTQLSIISPNNESNFVYTDDGNSLMLSGFEAFVDGDITVDITKVGQLNGTTFYDGLRLGFEDLAFGYRFEGYRLAEDTGDINDLKAKNLQSAQSINAFSGLSGLGGNPSLEGVINGQITLGAGGNEGGEGITVNADISITDGQMAKFIEADGSGKGLWLSGLNYDVHLRDMKLDVASEGLKIYEGESWSKMDVTDLRVGGKETGASFGRVVLESYEVASESIISAGGAGAVCIGGIGSTKNDCRNDNGRWDDRGDQGITIAAKKHFKSKIEAEGKRNRFTWEVARSGEGTAGVVNNSGLQLIFDNFTTNDGDGLTDTFGIQSTQSLDIARAPVIKKSTGIDSNGVFGNKGDEKIMLADGSYEYKSPASLTGADIQNRPVGVAFRNNTQFKELDIERVSLSHPVGGESTLLYGLKLQNFNITTDITATPMD
tara:strand:- start:2488 stop:5016 length:2529 start_codon:yes stop_codon:yes gene_type:complete